MPLVCQQAQLGGLEGCLGFLDRSGMLTREVGQRETTVWLLAIDLRDS
jgi:hypothetical protein